MAWATMILNCQFETKALKSVIRSIQHTLSSSTALSECFSRWRSEALIRQGKSLSGYFVSSIAIRLRQASSYLLKKNVKKLQFALWIIVVPSTNYRWNECNAFLHELGFCPLLNLRTCTSSFPSSAASKICNVSSNGH